MNKEMWLRLANYMVDLSLLNLLGKINLNIFKPY